MIDSIHNTTRPDEKQLLALSSPQKIPSLKAEQLFLSFQILNKAEKKKQIPPPRKRRRARKFISPCSV